MYKQMEITRNAVKWGNSAGVTLPKEWAGKQVKIILIDRTDKIKEEVLKILSPYLEDITGIYISGSYARGDYDSNSDIDIIAISNKTKKEISSGKYNVSIYPLEVIKKTIEKNPVLIYPRLTEAKTVINKTLLKELISITPGNNKKYIEETKRIITINEEIINLDKDEGKTSESVIYSLILRLRGILLIKSIKKNKTSPKKELLSLLKKEKLTELIKNYENIKKNNSPKDNVEIKLAEKLLSLLKKEVKEIE